MLGNHHEIEVGQSWEVDFLRPDDAPGVVKLFLSVYGEAYPIQTYIQPQLLIQENAEGRVISSVARTPKGDIVGHNALFHSAPFDGICESGAGVVHAAYRGGHGIFTRLVSHGQDVAARQFGIEAIFGESVCNHVFSQKMCYSLGWISRALEVDLMPAAAYEKEKSATGRVSSLMDFVTIRPRPHRVYIPRSFETALGFLYSGLDDKRKPLTSDAPFHPGSRTAMGTQYFEFARVARVAVEKSGIDFKARIKKEEKDLLSQGAVVIQVWLNLGEPWVGAAAEILSAGGFFFGGLLPRWFDTDGLLMQKILGTPCWEGMRICFDHGKKLVEIVKSDWKKSLERVEA